MLYMLFLVLTDFEVQFASRFAHFYDFSTYFVMKFGKKSFHAVVYAWDLEINDK